VEPETCGVRSPAIWAGVPRDEILDRAPIGRHGDDIAGKGSGPVGDRPFGFQIGAAEIGGVSDTRSFWLVIVRYMWGVWSVRLISFSIQVESVPLPSIAQESTAPFQVV
jgi:hypothetical protein